MTAKPKLLLSILSLLLCACASAQLEVARLSTKSFSGIGFGSFVNVAIPVSEANSVTTEAGFYVFRHGEDHVALVPFLLGFRHSVDGSGTGLYIEPMAGYSLGATDIQKTDKAGSPLLDPTTGDWAEQQAKGLTAGFSTGYIFSGNFAFNIGLRYQRVFVSGDPGMNMVSLRLSHTISFGRRND